MSLYGIYSEITNSHVLSMAPPSNLTGLLVVEVIVTAGLPLKIAFETGLNALSSLQGSGQAQQMVVLKITFA